jgi:putative NADH-flavin reductase
MRLLIVGASGGTGKALVDQAMRRGHTLTLLVRNHKSVSSHRGMIRIWKGDVLDPEAVDDAMSGQDAVLCSLGTGITFRPVKVFSQGTANLLAAMQKHSVPRIIAVTGIGAGDSRGHGGFLYDSIVLPLVLRTIYEDKDRQEQLIRKSDREWVIVRPGFLTDEGMKGEYKVLTGMDGVVAGHISRADVAAFMLAQLTTGEYLGKTVLLTE